MTTDSGLGLLNGYAEEEALALEFNKSPRTIRRWSDQPDGLPYVRIGSKRYYRLASVRAWLEGRERKPNPRRRTA